MEVESTTTGSHSEGVALLRDLHGERALVCAESGPLVDSEQAMVDLRRVQALISPG